MMWWPDAISDQFFLLVDPNLPLDGRVYHYSPLDFMRWLNGVTWASEWPKYRVKDAAGNDMPQPDKPPVRRISF